MQLSSNVIPFNYSRRPRCARTGKGLAGLGAGTGAAVGTAIGSAYGPIGAAAGGAIGGAFDSSGSGAGAAGAPGGMGLPGAAPSSTSVNPSLQTSISPQISPVFQQSYMPQNSAMTAGTTQNMPTNQGVTQPGMPGNPGMLPGGSPLDTSGFPPAMGGQYATPPVNSGWNTPQGQGLVPPGGTSFLSKYGVWIGGGVAGLILLAVLMKKRK